MPPKIIYEVPQQDNYLTYGKNCVFSLSDSNYGLAQMMFLEFTVTGTGQNYTTPSSPYLIKQVLLESYGTPIANVTTSYTLGRIDEEDYDLYNQIISGATFSGATLNGTQVVSLPLYFFAIDKQKLDTRHYKNLTVRVLTKDNYADMGFSGNITINKVRLKVVYEDPKLYKITPLNHFYNMNRNITEITADALTGNVVQLKINNPYIVSNMFFMIRKVSTASLKGTIKSIKVTYPNNEIGVYDALTNYQLGSEHGANYGNTFAIQLADRYVKEEDFFQATGQNAPMMVEITYDVSVIGDFKLYTAVEYYSDIIEGPDGLLMEQIKGSLNHF